MSALLRFKQSIAKQLEKHTAAKTNQLTLLFRYPKKRSQGHISLSMLKLQSSLKEPDQDLGTLAKQLVENVKKNLFSLLLAHFFFLLL
jgi:arginyl-tRNA synthetase